MIRPSSATASVNVPPVSTPKRTRGTYLRGAHGGSRSRLCRLGHGFRGSLDTHVKPTLSVSAQPPVSVAEPTMCAGGCCPYGRVGAWVRNAAVGRGPVDVPAFEGAASE